MPDVTGVNDPAKKPLSDKERELLRFVEQEFLLTGFVPTKEAAVERGLTTTSYYSKFIDSPHVRRALLARGISLPGSEGADKAAKAGILTAEQLAAANLMLDLRDNRSQRNKLKDLNVSSQKWEAWLRDPAFQSYLQRRAENLLGDNLHESHLALVDRVRSGDVSAIKYYNELTGRYIPSSTAKVDVNAILMRVLEIIQKYVHDPASLERIADEMLALSTINPALMNRGMKVIEALPSDEIGTAGPL